MPYTNVVPLLKDGSFVLKFQARQNLFSKLLGIYYRRDNLPEIPVATKYFHIRLAPCSKLQRLLAETLSNIDLSLSRALLLLSGSLVSEVILALAPLVPERFLFRSSA